MWPETVAWCQATPQPCTLPVLCVLRISHFACLPRLPRPLLPLRLLHPLLPLRLLRPLLQGHGTPQVGPQAGHEDTWAAASVSTPILSPPSSRLLPPSSLLLPPSSLLPPPSSLLPPPTHSLTHSPAPTSGHPTPTSGRQPSALTPQPLRHRAATAVIQEPHTKKTIPSRGRVLAPEHHLFPDRHLRRPFHRLARQHEGSPANRSSRLGLAQLRQLRHKCLDYRHPPICHGIMENGPPILVDVVLQYFPIAQ